VINRIRAEFFFKDGLIIRHTDDFDIWKWSSIRIPGASIGLDWLHAKENK
jgi:hypothetical protein